MIQNAAQMTNRGWQLDPNIQPPGFFYPSAQRPHLHVSSAFVNNQMAAPWALAYLGYTDAAGQRTVIFQRPIGGGNPGIDNPHALNNIPANLLAEATWAYSLK